MTTSTAAATPRVQIKEIMVEQAEGLSIHCRPETFTSWKDAEKHLFQIRFRAPRTGSYYKTDFKITFADGQVYSGRYDAYHPSVDRDESPSLSSHVVQHCRFLAGLWRPFHMTAEQHKAIMDRAEKTCPGIAAGAVELLTKYDLDQ